MNTNADALSRIINTINTNLITDYQEFKTYLNTHFILNPNVKEINTNLLQTKGSDPLVLFLPKNFERVQFPIFEISFLTCVTMI